MELLTNDIYLRYISLPKSIKQVISALIDCDYAPLDEISLMLSGRYLFGSSVGGVSVFTFQIDKEAIDELKSCGFLTQDLKPNNELYELKDILDEVFSVGFLD